MTVEEFRKLVESKRNPVVINRGVTPLSLLGVAFIVLKVMGYITWSWVWVLAPFWIPLCLALLIVAALLIIIAIAARGLVTEASEKVAATTETPSESKEETTEEVKEKKPRRKSKKNTDGEASTREPKEKND
jgi:predicted histidine transporter YuiF (NhaC family)